ncbi:MAG: serine hydrolase [Eubacteriales bacterium]|nr:serine hydrolase [Eubacteriales bacterium]
MTKKLLTAAILPLVLIIILAVPAMAFETPSGLTRQTMAEMIDQYADKLIGHTSPGAAVVVFSQDEIIFSKGYGYADLGDHQPVSPSTTVFEYGSISKLFVYTTIMQLVEKGQLDLLTDIRHDLPAGFLRNLHFEQPITLIDIMNHQAGFEDMLTDIVITDPVRRTRFPDILRERQPEQVYQPGTISAYSNYAVALAALIAENKLEQEFYHYLQTAVFQPLGMNSTTIHPDFLDHPELRERRARGHEADLANGTFHEIGWSYIPLYPVGAASGTAEDLARFAMALMPPDGSGGPLFKQRETLDAMFSQTMSMGPDMTGFAHGFIEYDGAVRGVGHGGNTAGFSAQMNIVPEQRFGVIVLVNSASEIQLTEGITQLLIGYAGSTPAPGDDQAELPDAAQLAGSYIQARRPHHGFLKLYGFLSLLQVEAIEHDTIVVRAGNQSGTYRQIQPYLYERTAASGPLFEYSFRKIYFDWQDDQVFRVSGDFTPLPKGYTDSWLMIDVLLAAVSVPFFVLTPLTLLLIRLIRRHKKRRVQVSDSAAGKTIVRPSWYENTRIMTGAMLFGGFVLVINNVLLIIRMLIDNYRAFAEVQPHLILNYPLALFPVAAAVLYSVHWKKTTSRRSQHMLFFVILLMLIILLYLLIKWEFIQLI